jgi:hypothetical protein
VDGWPLRPHPEEPNGARSATAGVSKGEGGPDRASWFETAAFGGLLTMRAYGGLRITTA